MDRNTFVNRTVSTTEVTLPGGDIARVRKLTQKEVETIQRDFATPETALAGFRFIASRATVDAQGVRVFTDDDQNKLLADADFDAVKAISEAATKFSGIDAGKKA